MSDDPMAPLRAAYVTQMQRAFHQGSRGIATPERRQAWHDQANRLIAAHDAEQVRELQAERDTWHERWRQLMRDHEAVVKERDELEAECLRVDEANTRLGERVCELQAENKRLQTALRRKENHRARARERVRQRDEVIERVRAALAGHPECDRYPNDGGEPILCGWKRAVVDVRAALEGAES